MEKDKSDDEDDEQNGLNKKKRTRRESPVSIKINEKGSSSSSSKKRSHSSSEKKRSHNADIADKDFDWNELELNSEIGSDHATEEVQQRTTTRKRKVNISEMFKPRKIDVYDQAEDREPDSTEEEVRQDTLSIQTIFPREVFAQW